MRNLIRFLVRYYAFMLFLLLEAVSLWLISQHRTYHHVRISNSTGRLVGGVNSAYFDLVSYFTLQEVNDSLQQEIALLRNGVLPPAMDVQFLQRDTVIDTVYNARYTYLPVKVLHSPIHRADNYILINRGSNDGVTEGMGLVGPSGIAGKVVHASPHYASVMSVLHRDFRTAVMLSRNGVRGTLRWAPYQPQQAMMDYVVEPADLKVGDTVVTAAASTFFPEGMPVGTIQAFSTRPGENFYQISILLSTRFNSLQYGYVVVDMHKAEKDSLLQTVPYE
jgi:rod shape-determining protein MreC